MTLDGRFLVEEDSGNFAGQPSKGFKMIGYNNASKRYEGIWTYTMSTAIMTLNGTSADGGKTVSFAASFDNEGGLKEKLNIFLRKIDDDHFVVDLRGTMPDGKPGPRLETTYTRRSKHQTRRRIDGARSEQDNEKVHLWHSPRRRYGSEMDQ
jgi:hypothetical protein